MPFAHLHYRWLRTTNYDYAKARRCYMMACIIYSVVFAILGSIFLGLYISKKNYLNSFNCMDLCAIYGATISCGYQCCQDIYGYAYSFQYCADDYGQGIYFILMLVFYGYAVYQFFLMIATLNRGSYFRNNNSDVIIVNNQNPQVIGMNPYGNQTKKKKTTVYRY